MDKPAENWFFGGKLSLWIVIAVLILIGGGIRFYDLTDLPLDFHPTRQLYSALKARGMYFNLLPTDGRGTEAEVAIHQWQSIQEIEPPVLEFLTAMLYRGLGEQLWYARALSILFWLAGSFPLFLLARRLSGNNGAIVALAFYLFVPYGIIASRSFQPDPLMVSLIISALWAMVEWQAKGGWKWAITAGLLTGAAIFVKNVAVFPLFFGILLHTLPGNFRQKIKNPQYWGIAGLAVFPTLFYTLYGLLGAGFLGQQFSFRFFPNLWIDPVFYLRWKEQIDAVIGFGTFMFALTGMFLAPKNGRGLLQGIWIGYLMYSMTFAYHTITHDYYQLMLIPICALSLAPVVETASHKIMENFSGSSAFRLAQGFFAVVLLLAMSIQVWNARVDLARKDYRAEAQRWASIGGQINQLGNPGPVLTIAEDYGYRLAYWGWQEVEAWLDAGDLNLRSMDGREIDLQTKFLEKASGKTYLVVTQMNKLDDQPEIKAFVFENFPEVISTDDFVVFDLGNQE